MLVALTGGCGRLGVATQAELKRAGYDFRVIDRSPTGDATNAFVSADLTDFDQATHALQGCEAVIHLAAIPSPDLRIPEQIVYSNNVLSNYHVLLAAGRAGIKKVCLASSINAVGICFSRAPTFDYFPIDEAHPTRAEDCYSISKWIGEQTADGIARRYEQMTICSLRYHLLTTSNTYEKIQTSTCHPSSDVKKQLWGYTDLREAARANVLALQCEWTGHEAFFITAKDTVSRTPSRELAEKALLKIPIRTEFKGFESFFDCGKAKRLLNWEHNFSWRD